MAKKIQYFGYALIGILLLIIGVLFISFNDSLKILTISIGIVLSVFSIIFGIITIASRDRGFPFVMKIIITVIALACGLVTAILNERAAEIVAALFALLMIVDGSFKLNTSAMAKKYDVGGWWIMLIPSVALIAGGFSIIKFALDTTGAMSVMLGILIIIDGIINFASIFFVPKYERNMKSDILTTAAIEEKIAKSQEKAK